MSEELVDEVSVLELGEEGKVHELACAVSFHTHDLKIQLAVQNINCSIHICPPHTQLNDDSKNMRHVLIGDTRLLVVALLLWEQEMVVQGSGMNGNQLLSRNLPTERSSHLNTSICTLHREVEKKFGGIDLAPCLALDIHHDLVELVTTMAGEKEMV